MTVHGGLLVGTFLCGFCCHPIHLSDAIHRHIMDEIRYLSAGVDNLMCVL